MAKVDKRKKYSPQLAEQICEAIAEGQSLRKICDNNEIMPDLRTIRRWLRDKEDFRLQYARAREEQADYYADRITELSDGVREDKNAIDKARLQTENLKWVASKLKPKKYGDKLDLTSDGEKLPAPLLGGTTNVPVETPKKK